MFAASWRNTGKGIGYGLLALFSLVVISDLSVDYEFPDWPAWVPALILLLSLVAVLSIIMASYHLSTKEVMVTNDRIIVNYGSAFFLVDRGMYHRHAEAVDISELFEEYIGPTGVRDIPLSEIVSFSVARDSEGDRVLYIERRSPLGDSTFNTRIYESDVGQENFEHLIRAVRDLASSKGIRFEDRSTYSSSYKQNISAYEVK